ncbi:MAG TPA: hypothetical protein VFP10_00475, partial [Candidatus Eisenbacteria bacterium]|nr:hypothetical protein [Candidatus Eisenbacteria bacterium]
MSIRLSFAFIVGLGVSLSVALFGVRESGAQAFLPVNPESTLRAAIDSIPGVPLTLKDALGLAVENDPAVKEARAGVVAAEGA